MTNFVKGYYRGGHRVVLGGVPCRVSYVPQHEGGKALMRESSRETCLQLPPRGRKDRAKWEAEQARKYAEAEKFGARSIDEVVTFSRTKAVESVEAVEAATSPAEAPSRPVEPVEAFSRRLPSRPMTRRPVGAMSGAMRVIHYYRVSTARQGRSGLGLEAQRASVEAFCAGRGCQMLGEYVEVESGKNDARPELAKALHHAKVTGATLVIAKLDRLTRNAAFLMALRDSGARFLAADMPDANELTVGIMALVAQQEREQISARTKAALGAAKARGVRLGNPMAEKAFGDAAARGVIASRAVRSARASDFAADVVPIVEALRAEGFASLNQIAAELNAREIQTSRGGKWTAKAVSRVLDRVEIRNSSG